MAFENGGWNSSRRLITTAALAKRWNGAISGRVPWTRPARLRARSRSSECSTPLRAATSPVAGRPGGAARVWDRGGGPRPPGVGGAGAADGRWRGRRPRSAHVAGSPTLASRRGRVDRICLPGDSAKMRAENGSEPGMPGLAPEVTLAGRWLHTGRLHGHGAAVAVEYKCSGGGRPCRSVTTERGAVGAPAEHVWQ